MHNCDSEEPYKATKLWNEVILAFRTGMPVKKHRWRMRFYDNCFTASECISWLNCYLKNNVNFGADVTRLQTMQLLKKFLKCNVIENVCRRLKKTEFSDNSQLYRFVQYSPIKPRNKSSLQTLLRAPLSVHCVNNFENNCDPRKNNLCLENQLKINESTRVTSELNLKKPMQDNKCTKSIIPECHFVSRQLSVEEVENIWKVVVLKRLELAIHPIKLQDVLDLRNVNGRFIFNNITQVSKSGVVTLIDKTDDIPHWVISAMKCLVNWPNASGSGSCLPNYPGFEKDVFKVIRDFFINSQISLIPSMLYPLIVELCCQRPRGDESCNTVCHDQISVLSVASKDSSKIQKTSTPLVQILSTQSVNAEDPVTDTHLSSQTVEGKIILDDPNVMWECPSMCFETEFSDVNPVTRVVPNDPLAICFPLKGTNFCSQSGVNAGSIESMSTISACSQTSETFSLHTQGQSEDLLQTDADELFFSAVDFREGNESKMCDDCIFNMTFKHSFDNFGVSKNHDKIKPTSCTSLNAMTIPKRYKGTLPDNQLNINNFSAISVSTDDMKFKTENNSSHLYSWSCGHICDVPSEAEHQFNVPRSYSILLEKKFGHEISSPYFHSHRNEVKDVDHGTVKSVTTCVTDFPLEPSPGKINVQVNQLSVSNTFDPEETSSYRCFVSEEQKQKFKEAFQILLLLLPPPNRRQLHLLLRMISKVVKNDNLTFESKVPLRTYFLETFLPAILDTNHKLMCDEVVTYEIVSIMLDECETLFQTPFVLKDDAEKRLAEMRRGRIKYTLDDSCILTYCELVSQQQYEEQKVSMSKQALVDLLERIINDKGTSEREKKKKLKQFRSNHPEIYAIRFPDLNGSQEASKPKKALFAKILNLRL